jgi:two-component system sensor histidine kinase VanS
MDPGRPHARSPDSHHVRHADGRERIALPPNRAGGPSGRVPRARRRLRHHARAARGTRRRTAAIRNQRLLDVARTDPNRDTSDLDERLRAVNARAIDLTEALLLLSRADQRSFTRDRVYLSLVAEEATETLLPLAEKRSLTIETSGDMTATVGSHALLLQMTTNLVHNAIVHNLPDRGTVWVTTSTGPKTVTLTVENTGERLDPQLASTLAEPFQRGTKRIRTDHAGVGLGLAIVKSITQAHEGTLTLTPRDAGGLCVTVQLPTARAG